MSIVQGNSPSKRPGSGQPVDRKKAVDLKIGQRLKNVFGEVAKGLSLDDVPAVKELVGPAGAAFLEQLRKDLLSPDNDQKLGGSLGTSAARVVENELLGAAESFLRRTMAAKAAPDLSGRPTELDHRKMSVQAGADGQHEVRGLASNHALNLMFDQLGVERRFGPRIGGVIRDAAEQQIDLAGSSGGVSNWTNVAMRMLAAGFGAPGTVHMRLAAAAQEGFRVAAEVGADLAAKKVQQVVLGASGAVERPSSLPEGVVGGGGSSARPRAGGLGPMGALIGNRVGSTPKPKPDADKLVREALGQLADRADRAKQPELAERFRTASGSQVAAIRRAVERALTGPDGRPAQGLELLKRIQGELAQIPAHRDGAENALTRLQALEGKRLPPRIETRIDEFSGRSIAKLVAAKLGVEPQAADRLSGAAGLRGFTRSLLNLDDLGQFRGGRMGIEVANDREAAAAGAMAGTDTLPPGLELADPAGSARRLWDRYFADASDVCQLPPKQREPLEAAIKTAIADVVRNGQPVDGFAFAEGLVAYLGQLGVPAETLKPALEQLATLAAQLGEVASARDTAEGVLKNQERALSGAERRLGQLESAAAKIEAQLAGAPEGDPRRADLESAQREAAAQKAEVERIRATAEGARDAVENAVRQAGEIAQALEMLGRGTLLAIGSMAVDPEGTTKDFQQPANGTRPPDGPAGDADPVDEDLTKRSNLALERAAKLGAVLDDPALSLQDKIFYFMLLFSQYADKEREDKLQKLVKLDQASGEWDLVRGRFDARLDNVQTRLMQLNAEADALREERRVLIAGGADPMSKEVEAIRSKLDENRGQATALRTEKEKVTSEKEKAHAVRAPKLTMSRETLFAELDKVTKQRDQIINMTRSLIDDSNRLIERIFR